MLVELQLRMTLAFIFFKHWLFFSFLGGSQMSRIWINILHHRTANKSDFFQAENRLLAKSANGFAIAWSCSYFQVILYVLIVQQLVITKRHNRTCFVRKVALARFFLFAFIKFSFLVKHLSPERAHVHTWREKETHIFPINIPTKQLCMR